jgi:type I restriction enzyme S subunit
MKTINLLALDAGTGRPSLTQAILNKIEIPIPPLNIQAEIVRILDAFTALTAELTAELTARKKQYNYYRDQLLSFEEGEVEWKTLGDIGEVRMCKRILKNQTSETGDIPFYKIGTFGKEPNAYISQEIFNEYKARYSYPKIGEVLISASGTIGRAVIFDGKDAYFQDSNIIWIENNESQALNKYLFYFYKIANWNVAEGGTIQRLYNDNLRKMKIPIPPLAEQTRIVAILDKFDALTNSITEGLPREIKLRQQQYEYYRDLLLSFPKPIAETPLESVEKHNG